MAKEIREAGLGAIFWGVSRLGFRVPPLAPERGQKQRRTFKRNKNAFLRLSNVARKAMMPPTKSQQAANPQAATIAGFSAQGRGGAAVGMSGKGGPSGPGGGPSR